MRLFDHASSMYFSLTRKSDKFEDVETTDFRKLFEVSKVDAFDFMKIDIEGAEEELLLSETDTFKNHRIKTLYIDPHLGVDYDRIIAHLAQFNYSCEKVGGGYLFYMDKSSLG